MTEMPRLTGGEMIGSLRRAGFAVARRKGSHVVMKHPDGRGTVVPAHAGEVLGRGLMSKIQRDVALDRESFIRLLTE